MILQDFYIVLFTALAGLSLQNFELFKIDDIEEQSKYFRSIKRINVSYPVLV